MPAFAESFGGLNPDLIGIEGGEYSEMEKELQKIKKYFIKHPDYNSVVNLIAGMGLGIFMTYPIVGEHPLRWAVILFLVAIMGHLYPLVAK